MQNKDNKNEYKKNQYKTHAIIMACVLLVLISFAMSIFFGAREMSYHEVLSAWNEIGTGTFDSIIIENRIKRTVFAFIAGAALSISGVLMQVITKNPIADPSILGVNNGAALSVVLGIAIFGIHSFHAYIIFGLAGAFVTAIVVFLISTIGYKGDSPLKLVLAGVAVSAVMSSMITLLILPSQSLSDKYRFWQVGSVGAADIEQIKIMAIILLFIMIVLRIISPVINTLSMGDDIAFALGVDVVKYRMIIASFSVILCGFVTAMCGPISFIGLMAPHVARSIVGADYKKLVPLGATIGGIILLISDTIGRVLARPGELEVGIVTAFIGAPILVIMAINAKETSI